MKRILFCGCLYGAGNIGDDAILEGLLCSFKNTKENIEFGAISINPEHTKSATGLNHVWPNTIKAEHEAIRWATHIVLGGGTLITEHPCIRYPLRHCCRIIDHAIHYQKPISMLGAGISKINTNKAKKFVSDYYNKYLDVITVRSSFDKQQAIQKGINEELMIIGADCAYSLNVKKKWKPENIIALSLVSEGHDHIGYADRIANALNKFKTENQQFSYMGICSEIRKETQFDYPMIKTTLDKLGDFPVQDEYKTPKDFIDFLAQFNVVFTMRMHILVFCALAGIPCIAMIREEKTENMLNSLGMEKYLWMNASEKEILEMFQQAIENPERFIPDAENVEKLKQAAENNPRTWIDCYKNNIKSNVEDASIIRKLKADFFSSIITNKSRYIMGGIKYRIKKINK